MIRVKEAYFIILNKMLIKAIRFKLTYVAKISTPSCIVAGTTEVVMVLFLKHSLSSDFIENENLLFSSFPLNTGEDIYSCNVRFKMLGIKIRKVFEMFFVIRVSVRNC